MHNQSDSNFSNLCSDNKLANDEGINDSANIYSLAGKESIINTIKNSNLNSKENLSNISNNFHIKNTYFEKKDIVKFNNIYLENLDMFHIQGCKVAFIINGEYEFETAFTNLLGLKNKFMNIIELYKKDQAYKQRYRNEDIMDLISITKRTEFCWICLELG